MKKLSLLSLIVLFFVSCATANTQKQNQKQSQGNSPFMTRTFKASSIKEVEATTAGGSLTLTGDAGSDAVVEVYVSRNDWSAEKIKEVLDKNYTIDIKVESGKLSVFAKSKSNIINWDQQGLSISFKISASKQVTSQLRTSGGSIQISNLSGSQNFTTSGGSLSIENTSGNINGKTSGGSITATDCDGNINIATSGGSLQISNLSGTVNATTSGGSITVSGMKGTLKTGTSGGNVRLDGISGNLEATTSGGNMDVKIKSVSDYVKLSNSGSLNLTLPAGRGYNLNVNANKIESSGLKDFRGNNDENKSLNGTVGSGGPEINVRSSQKLRLSFE